MTYEYLTLDQLLDLAASMGVPHVRDLGLLESARVRPQIEVFGEESYPSLSHKAAALLESLVRNHPLLDGNKRLGWTSAIVFLGMNNRAIEVDDDMAVDFVLSVAAGEMTFEEIVTWFEARI